MSPPQIVRQGAEGPAPSILISAGVRKNAVQFAKNVRQYSVHFQGVFATAMDGAKDAQFCESPHSQSESSRSVELLLHPLGELVLCGVPGGYRQRHSLELIR